MEAQYPRDTAIDPDALPPNLNSHCCTAAHQTHSTPSQRDVLQQSHNATWIGSLDPTARYDGSMYEYVQCLKTRSMIALFCVWAVAMLTWTITAAGLLCGAMTATGYPSILRNATVSMTEKGLFDPSRPELVWKGASTWHVRGSHEVTIEPLNCELNSSTIGFTCILPEALSQASVGSLFPHGNLDTSAGLQCDFSPGRVSCYQALETVDAMSNDHWFSVSNYDSQLYWSDCTVAKALPVSVNIGSPVEAERATSVAIQLWNMLVGHPETEPYRLQAKSVLESLEVWAMRYAHTRKELIALDTDCYASAEMARTRLLSKVRVALLLSVTVLGLIYTMFFVLTVVLELISRQLLLRKLDQGP